MKGYDENYEKYMTAFGIPSIIVSLIVGKPETLIVTEPDEDQSFYTIKKITGKTMIVVNQVTLKNKIRLFTQIINYTTTHCILFQTKVPEWMNTNLDLTSNTRLRITKEKESCKQFVHLLKGTSWNVTQMRKLRNGK